MGQEIERKFLVKADRWSGPAGGAAIRQGYLSLDRERTVRVRIEDERGSLTVKGPVVAGVRAEFEYAIPLDDARQLLGLAAGLVVEKTRHRFEQGGLVWEVDEFHGANAPLVLAEVELTATDQQVILPDWVGLEVTEDPRFFNSYLARNPYGTW